MIKTSLLWSLPLLGFSTLGLSSFAASVQLRETHPESQWRGILDIFRGDGEDHGDGGNHGSRDPFCIVTPQSDAEIWSLQPLFLWSNQTQTIAVKRLEAADITRQEPTEAAEPDLLQATYSGSALEPGATYQWLFYFHAEAEAPMFWRTFQVLGGEERDRISAELDTLTAILKIQDADAEAIALERTRYFLAEDLLADALQEIFSVENPSAVLIETREALVAEICQSQTAAAAQAPGDASEN